MSRASSGEYSSAPSGRGWLALAVGALISVAAVWLIASNVNLNAVAAALAAGQWQFIALACIVQLAAMLISNWRWQVLLRPYPTRFLGLGQVYFVAHLLNTILPFKLGTVARILLAAESENLNAGFVLGSLVTEKVLDIAFVIVLIVVLTPFAPLPAWVAGSLTASFVLLLVALLALAAVRRLRDPFLAWCACVETRLFPKRAPGQDPPLTRLMRGLLENLANVTQRRELLPLLGLTLIIWLGGAIVNQLLFIALGLDVPWSATWFLIVALQVGTRVPALPANLGVFHYIVILALGLYGIAESPALAYAIVLHLVVFIIPALIGAVCALPLTARLLLLVTHSLRRTT